MHVIELRAAPPAAPVVEVVEVLERLLTLARAGELRAVAVGGVLTGGESLHPYAFDAGVAYATIAGAVAITGARVIRAAERAGEA